MRCTLTAFVIHNMQSGRAVPDVSAVSTNFQVLIQNFTGPISGMCVRARARACVRGVLHRCARVCMRMCTSVCVFADACPNLQ